MDPKMTSKEIENSNQAPRREMDFNVDINLNEMAQHAVDALANSKPVTKAAGIALAIALANAGCTPQENRAATATADAGEAQATASEVARPTDVSPTLPPLAGPSTEVPPLPTAQPTTAPEVVVPPPAEITRVPFEANELQPGRGRTLEANELAFLDANVVRENFVAEKGVIFRFPKTGQLVAFVGPRQLDISIDNLAVAEDYLLAHDGFTPNNKLKVIDVSNITGGEDASGDRSLPGGWILDAAHNEENLPNTEIAIVTMPPDELIRYFTPLTPEQYEQYGIPNNFDYVSYSGSDFLVKLMHWMGRSRPQSASDWNWGRDFYYYAIQNGLPLRIVLTTSS